MRPAGEAARARRKKSALHAAGPKLPREAEALEQDTDRGGARVRRGQGRGSLSGLVASGRRGEVAARRLVPGSRPEGRHVDWGAGNGPGVRVGGAFGGRGEYGCSRGIGRGEGTTGQRELRCGGDESDAARTLLTWVWGSRMDCGVCGWADMARGFVCWCCCCLGHCIFCCSCHVLGPI